MPGVIFDLDGTLADTLDDLTDSINVVLAGLGQAPASRERIRSMVGDGLSVLLQRVTGIDDADRVASLVEQFRPVYTQRMLKKTRRYPGISEVLDELAARNVPMCVLSNKPHEHTKRICESLFGGWPFVSFQGASEEVPKKPDPRGALRLAELMHRRPFEVFFVGDSKVDIQTARNAGMVPISVTWGYGDLDDSKDIVAGPMVDDPARLIRLILDV